PQRQDDGRALLRLRSDAAANDREALGSAAVMRAAGLAAAAWLLTGVYVVRADERAVVRRFGAVVAERVPPGLHVGLPWGIDVVDRLRIHEQQRLTVGFEAPDALLGRQADPIQREFFTGDQNLVNVELLLQYTVADGRAYLFSAADRTASLRAAAEAAVTGAA